MYMFSEKHVRLFSETRTRIYENTYVFFQKDDGDIQAIRILSISLIINYSLRFDEKYAYLAHRI